MSKIVTKELINQRLKNLNKDAILVGEYIKQQVKTTFNCSKGHSWIATPDNVLRKSGCPQCADTRISKEEFIKKLASRTTSMLVGEYVNYSTTTTFECQARHRWNTKPKFIISGKHGNGCARCQTSQKQLTKQIVNQRLQNRGIELISNYKDAVTKSLFKCNKGHTWHAVPDSVMGGKGCSQCAKTGFNPLKPAVGYILEFDDFIKFGITNNLKSRLKAHKVNGVYTVAITKTFELGTDARTWENTVKQKYQGYYVTKQKCPDGWTETLPKTALTEVATLLTS